MGTIIIPIHSAKQVEVLSSFLQTLPQSERSSVMIVALRADIELSLNKKEIPFESAKNLRTVNPADTLRFVDGLISGVIENEKLSFWQYKNIPLGKIRRVVLQDYFSILIYWLDIFSQICITWSPDKIILLKSEFGFVDKTFLQDEYALAPETAATLACQKFNVHIQAHQIDNFFSPAIRKINFLIKRNLFSAFLFLVNNFITLTEKPKKTRILITDIWRNTAKYAEKLSDTEFIFLDRTEFRKIGWNNIKKYRIRFLGYGAFGTLRGAMRARMYAKTLSYKWKNVLAETDNFLNPTWQDIPLGPTLQRLLRRLISKQSIDDMASIEAVRSMLTKVRPDVVVVRASASRQTHFSFLCYLAKELSIPSVEPQHGFFYLGPNSVPKNSVVEYLATYGPLVSKELKEVGFKGVVIDVGSPRFDDYSKLAQHKVENDMFTVLFVLSDDYTGVWFDTYDILFLLDIIKSLAEKNKNVHIIVKARAGASISSFGFKTAIKEFENIQTVSVISDESLTSLLGRVNLVVSVFSTILLEAIAANRPTIYWAQSGFYESVAHAQIEKYVSGGGVRVAFSAEEISHNVEHLMDPEHYQIEKKRIADFVKNNFSFSEGSPERLANLLLQVKVSRN